MKQLRGQTFAALIIRATLGSAGLRIAGMVLSFVLGVQLARTLGAHGYGVYGLAMSIVALLNVPTHFGVPQVLTREVARAHSAKDWPRVRGVINWANLTVLAAALLVAGAVSLCLHFLFDGPQGLEATLYCGLGLIPLIALGNVRGATLRGLQRIVLGQLPEIIVRPATFSLLLLGAFLAFESVTPTQAMALHVAAAAVAFGSGAWLLQLTLPKGSEVEASRAQSRGLLASAFPMALTEGMRVLQGHLAILLLGLYASVGTVGIFRVSLSTMAIVATPISILNVVSAPVIARLHAEEDFTRLKRLATATAVAMFLGVSILSLPLIVAGKTLLSAAFGHEFEASHPSLLLLCLGQGVSAIFGANATLLNMTGNERRVTRAFSVALVVNIVAALVLIPFRGDIGAAEATILSLLAWNVIMWLDARRLLLVDSSIFSALFPGRAKVH